MTNNKIFDFYVDDNQKVKINIEWNLKSKDDELSFVKEIGEILTKYCDNLTFSFVHIDKDKNVLIDYYTRGKQYKNFSIGY